MSSRRFRLPRWAWAVLAVAVLGAFFIGEGTRSSSPSAAAAPAWSGTELNGTVLTSGEERGRWVVLNFFATWCDPCQQETPQLARFAAANPTSRVQVVGVIFSDPTSAARAFARSHGVTWPLLSDPGNRISSSYRVVALPQSFVIRPNGTLAQHLFGGVTAAELQKIVGTD